MSALSSKLSDVSRANELLAGQVIAITDADQGYGKSISTAMARAGASVVLIGNSTEPLAAAASVIEQLGSNAIPIKADVSIPLDWVNAQTRIIEIFGVLNGVVHIADKRTQTNFADLRENEWMNLFNENLKSSVGITQVIRRRLPKTWLTLIGPHTDDTSLQALLQRGALSGLVEGGCKEDLRLNLLLPSRASSGEEEPDQALCNVVLALAVSGLTHLRGNVIKVPMPAMPKLSVNEINMLP